MYYGSYKNCFAPIARNVNQLVDALPPARPQIVYDIFPFWEIADTNFCFSLKENMMIKKQSDSPHVIRSESLLYLEKWSNHFQIFTDGSKKDDLCACAFYIPALKFHRKFRLSDSSSIFEAELLANLKALDFLVEKPPFQAVILSDSLSALQAIQDGGLYILVKEIMYSLFLLSNRGIDISFAWVPSHVGIVANEMADKYAKQGLYHDEPDFELLPDVDDVSNIILDIVMAKWQHRWDTEERGRFYYNIEPQVAL